MRLFRMPPQLVRLVLLTIAIVASYLVARYFLTPPSFRQYGFYRGDSLEELANSRETTFAGKKACEECHSDDNEVKRLAKGEHKGLSCEACHGPCQAHADKPDDDKLKPPKLGYSSCVRCHEFNPSRPKWHHQINSKTHYSTGQKCTECHVPHQPLEVP
jgi:hypothetical protein